MLHKRAWGGGAHLPLLVLEPVGGEPLMSGAWPVRRQTYVTFPAARHHHPLANTKFYCLVTVVHVC